MVNTNTENLELFLNQSKASILAHKEAFIIDMTNEEIAIESDVMQPTFTLPRFNVKKIKYPHNDVNLVNKQFSIDIMHNKYCVIFNRGASLLFKEGKWICNDINQHEQYTTEELFELLANQEGDTEYSVYYIAKEVEDMILQKYIKTV